MSRELWPWQKRVEPLLTSGPSILWHEMRLGKTGSAINAYNKMLDRGEVQDLIFVTVASAKATIKQERDEMELGIPTYTLFGETPGEAVGPLLDLPRIYILNWEILPHWQRWLKEQTFNQNRKFVLVLDESHLYCRNASQNQRIWTRGQRYDAALWLSRFAEAAWLLTGTLLVKSGLDIYWQAKLLGRKADPFYRWTLDDFGETFCETQWNPFIGKEKLLRDRKGGWVWGKLINEQALIERFPALDVLRIQDVSDTPLPTQLPRWISDLGQEWDFDRNDATLAEELAALIPIKVKLTVDYVRELEQRPLVVFGWNILFTEAVAKELKAPLIRGGTPVGERERIRQEFQAGQIPVLVGNFRSLGLGVSLSRADTFVYGQPYWDASLYLQVMARGTSLDKTQPTVHHHLLLAGSAEEYVWKRRLDRGKDIERLYNAAGEPSGELELPLKTLRR